MFQPPQVQRGAGKRRNERGASLVEYALLVALIAVVCITAVTFLGSSASTKFNGAGEGIEGNATTTTLPNSAWQCVQMGYNYYNHACHLDPPPP